jgi:Fasciclin domain
MQDLDGAAPLLAAVNATEETDDPITLFAPTNEAFEEISAVVATLSSEDILDVCLHLFCGTALRLILCGARNQRGCSGGMLLALMDIRFQTEC